jgi:hypothetical protein
MSLVEQNETLYAMNRAGGGIALMTMAINIFQDNKNFL